MALTMYVIVIILASCQISSRVVYQTSSNMFRFSVYTTDLAAIPTITLSNLGITDVHEISNFPAVTTLDFSYNSLWRIPNLTNVSATLETVFLEQNRIAAVSADTVVYVPNMPKIDLKYNLLTGFPHLDHMAGALQVLDLGHNEIMTVEMKDVPTLPALNTLSLISKYTFYR